MKNPPPRSVSSRKRLPLSDRANSSPPKFRFLDFFSGSGLVTEGMREYFAAVWANDICPKKAAVYQANFGSAHYSLADIKDVRGCDLPSAELGWASFPCQDLSLAGQIAGINGERSGLVWEWLRIIDELGSRKPPILVAENVAGLVSADEGKHYRALHEALRERGYSCGAMELDAVRWVPQSRPRIFVVCVSNIRGIAGLTTVKPGWVHSEAVQRVAQGLQDWIWWKLPTPAPRCQTLDELVDFEAPCDSEPKSRRNLALIAPKHQSRLLQELANGFRVAPGYKRTRNGHQVLELRFDKVSGCLRTPNGGSSRQVLVLKRQDHLATRLVTVREAARLMGVRDSFHIPGTFNDGYRAMGDAVAVPVVQHLVKHLLIQLAKRLHE